MDDTIVAISTAAGSAARAIVRLSGSDAVRLGARVFEPTTGCLEQIGGFRSADGLVRAKPGRIELPCRAYVFRAPRSYTRQDVVELHIPGPAAASTSLASVLIDAGARQALPGEFTARAFLSGRIDLSEAEAVADVVCAADDAKLRSAIAAMGGQVHRFCRQAAGSIADILAGVEASIDLSSEDIVLDTPADLAERLDGLACRLRSIAAEATEIPETTEQPHVVLAGRVNVGKSSLLNAISGTDRAITSALAGTTRDVLSAPVRLDDGSAFILQDAAGFGRAETLLDEATNTAARRAVAAADLVLFVADLTDRAIQKDRQLLDQVRSANRRAPMLLVANKLDLLDKAELQHRLAEVEGLSSMTALGTSAVTGTGLGRLRDVIGERLGLSAGRSGDALGLHDRQRRCLIAAAAGAQRACSLVMEAGEVADCAELVAVELRESLGELSAISGEIVTEDILGRIFSRFCVGK